MDPTTQPQSQGTIEGRTGRWSYTRLVATLVLLPSVPMLLFSLAALALFYIAPTRFGNLISRLPGETYIRSALVFAPVTLFAIVVLAVLYAVERPAVAVSRTRSSHGVEGVLASGIGMDLRIHIRRVARLTLAPAVLASLISMAVWALSFVSPGRFDRLMTPLPGDRYLRPFVPIAPFVLFIFLLFVIYLAHLDGSSAYGETHTSRPLNLAVGMVLASAIPILLLSLAMLGLSYLSPSRFDRLIARLPYEEFIRLTLTFAPAVLFAVVLLALLYLYRQRISDVYVNIIAHPSRERGLNSQELRSVLATWVLAWGLILTAVVGLAMLCVVIYLLLR